MHLKQQNKKDTIDELDKDNGQDDCIDVDDHYDNDGSSVINDDDHSNDEDNF